MSNSENENIEAQLKSCRDKIDDHDRRIVELVNSRASIAQEIARLKARDNSPIFRPGREREVYRRIHSLNKGPLTDAHLEGIYREIMSAIIDLEGTFKVAFLGPRSSFTHQAAIKKFGSSLETFALDSIPAIFREVEKGNFRYGVVPIENSTEGVVTYTLDQFLISDLNIYSEVYLKVQLSLLSRTSDRSKIKTIYSHPQGLAQCRNWLYDHFPGVELVETSSTSRAAQMVVEQGEGTAAVASELASKIFNLDILERNVQDNPKNVTRFLIIGYDHAPVSGEDKTSIVCSLKDQVGALHHILQPFSDAGVNLTRIESRPNKRENWEYNFYIDLEGHIEDKNVRHLLNDLAKRTVFLKVLGSYPNGMLK